MYVQYNIDTKHPFCKGHQNCFDTELDKMGFKGYIIISILKYFS